MSLTLALVLVALLVLAGIAGHAYWKARSVGPRRAVPGDAAPPLAPQRVEPSFGDLDAADAAPARSAPLRRQARLDAVIDAIVELTLEAPVSGEAVLAHLPSTRRAGTKPFYIEGLDSETGDWEAPAPGRRYGELQAGVQLTNRSGALNQIEYSEFVQKMQAFAEGVGASADFPDMLDVAARARELDNFANPLDAQLGVTLRSNDVAWSIGYVQQCASRHGFQPGTLPGRLVLPGADDGAPPVLVLSFDPQAALADDPQQAAVREVQLSLDVAQTPAASEPFSTWLSTSRLLSDDMGATAVDANGAPITLQAFAAIGEEIDQLYAKLDARGLAAGSPAARRLFS